MRHVALLLWVLAVPLPARAQDADEATTRRRTEEYVKARSVWEAPGLTTSLRDCRTEAPFLDSYTPERFLPLAEMPRVRGRGFFLVATGAYELEAASFCLCAGAYRPARGEGYSYAPLAGCAAEQVHAALWSWADHPELDWESVQHLLWALEGRLDPGRWPPALQVTARTLLGTEGLARAAAAARGPEPELTLVDPRLAAELQAAGGRFAEQEPAAARELEAAGKALEALTARMERGEQVAPAQLTAALERLGKAQEAALRPVNESVRQLSGRLKQLETALATAAASFEQIERAAVREGEPPPPAGSREVPRGRWSYHPGGCFVRYLPEDYTHTRLEVSLPAPAEVQRDGRGRLASLRGAAGSRLLLAYEDAAAQTVAGDPGLRAEVLRKVAFTAAGDAASTPVAAAWTFVGAPAGTGTPLADARLPGAAQRYREAVLLRDELRALRDAVAPGAPVEATAELLDLGHLAAALEAGGGRGEAAQAALRLVQEAWQAAVRERLPFPAARAAVPAAGGAGACGPGRRDGMVRLAAAPGLTALGLTVAGATGGDLPILDPGWDGIHPANSARQRLGLGPVQTSDAEGKELLRQAVQSCELLQGALDVFNGLADPVGFVMEKLGLGSGGLPGMMLGEFVDWIFEMGASLAAALGGDPPRADFQALTPLTAPELPQLVAGPGLSVERARTGNEAARALLEVCLALRAAQTAADRLGGAVAAGSDDWAWRQAGAFVYYKRLAGKRMLTAAERYEALLEVLADEGVEDRAVSVAQLRAYQQKLRTTGFSDGSLQAAKTLGITAEEVELARQRRLAIDPEESPDEGVLARGEALVAGLRGLGGYWQRLPEVPEPR